MAKGKAKGKARRGKGRKPAKKSAFKSKNNTGEFASLSCARTMTIVPPAPGATVTNQMYAFNNFRLSDFPRAVQVAAAYQHYRISGIKLTFKAVYDTFAAGGLQKQWLYYMIDKADAIPTTVTLEGLKQMGARPIEYDNRGRTITWRPSVIMDAEVGVAGSPAAYKVSPWLATNATPGAPGVWNPSTVAHKGLKWYVEAPAIGNAQTVYVEVELQFQFKKPLVNITAGATEAIPGSYPELDNSPDGVVGGTDGITLNLTQQL